MTSETAAFRADKQQCGSAGNRQKRKCARAAPITAPVFDGTPGDRAPSPLRAGKARHVNVCPKSSRTAPHVPGAAVNAGNSTANAALTGAYSSRSSGGFQFTVFMTS